MNDSQHRIAGRHCKQETREGEAMLAGLVSIYVCPKILITIYIWQMLLLEDRMQDASVFASQNLLASSITITKIILPDYEEKS